MSDIPEALTAKQLDEMSPDERAQAFRDRIVTDPELLPADFREKIYRRARNLGNQVPNPAE